MREVIANKKTEGCYCKKSTLMSFLCCCYCKCCGRRSSGGKSPMGYVQEARENHVKKKVEEALRSKMKQKALKECDHYSAKYAECVAGKTISVVWLCRKQAKELNQCLHQYTNDSVLEEMKKNYMLEQENKDKSMP